MEIQLREMNLERSRIDRWERIDQSPFAGSMNDGSILVGGG